VGAGAVVDLTDGRTKGSPKSVGSAGGVTAAGGGAKRTPKSVGTAAGLYTAKTSEMQKLISMMKTKKKQLVMLFCIKMCCS